MEKKSIIFSPKQKKIIENAEGLILDRVFMKIDAKLNDKERQEMEKVFASDNDKQKALLLKQYAPNFVELLKEETLKTVKEIKDKIQLKKKAR